MRLSWRAGGYWLGAPVVRPAKTLLDPLALTGARDGTSVHGQEDSPARGGIGITGRELPGVGNLGWTCFGAQRRGHPRLSRARMRTVRSGRVAKHVSPSARYLPSREATKGRQVGRVKYG